MLFGDVFMRKYPVIYNKQEQTMGFHGFPNISRFLLSAVRALPMGILDTKFIRAVEWMWLGFAILVLMMLIGINIGISSIRRKARRHVAYYSPNQVYVN